MTGPYQNPLSSDVQRQEFFEASTIIIKAATLKGTENIGLGLQTRQAAMNTVWSESVTELGLLAEEFAQRAKLSENARNASLFQ